MNHTHFVVDAKDVVCIRIVSTVDVIIQLPFAVVQIGVDDFVAREETGSIRFGFRVEDGCTIICLRTINMTSKFSLLDLQLLPSAG